MTTTAQMHLLQSQMPILISITHYHVINNSANVLKQSFIETCPSSVLGGREPSRKAWSQLSLLLSDWLISMRSPPPNSAGICEFVMVEGSLEQLHSLILEVVVESNKKNKYEYILNHK